jgi:RNA polymerase subunit RPABC4/transcription elongation factor Spt4
MQAIKAFWYLMKFNSATKACSCCSCKIKKDAKFCPNCGSPQTQAQFCKNCGNKFLAQENFCSECGTKRE